MSALIIPLKVSLKNFDLTDSKFLNFFDKKILSTNSVNQIECGEINLLNQSPDQSSIESSSIDWSPPDSYQHSRQNTIFNNSNKKKNKNFVLKLIKK